MFHVLNENNEGVFESGNFKDAAEEAIRLNKIDNKCFAVVQEVWNTLMLLEENENINNLVEVA